MRRSAAEYGMHELYATETIWQIIFVTGILGGGAAALSGRAIALTWRPYWHVLVYMLLLGAAVRFVHFALFEADLLSWPSYIVDTLYFVALGSLSFRLTRVRQMVRQYPWLYERLSLLAWRERTGT
jgi:hypothetical protein